MADAGITVDDGIGFVEIKIPMPDKDISLTGGRIHHQSTTVVESVSSPAEATHTLTADSPDYVHRILRRVMEQGVPFIEFKMGIGIGGNVNWRPWQRHVIQEPRSRPEGIGRVSGHAISMTTKDLLWHSARYGRIAPRQGRISQIVEDIASKLGMESVVEPTAGEFLYVQSGISDIDFIRERLLPRATSASGHGNYFLYVRDNVLHFHTADYQSKVVDFDYYTRSAASIRQIDGIQQAFGNGGTGIRLIVYDPYTGRSEEILSDASRALRLGNTIADTTDNPESIKDLGYHLGTNRPEEAVSIANNLYEGSHQVVYTSVLEVERYIGLRAGDFIRLTITPKIGQASPWSGLWLVRNAAITVERGKVTSVYTLTRGEMEISRSNTASIINQGVDVVDDETVAPGRQISLKGVEASRLTAGPSTKGRSVLRTVTDPESAP